MVTSELVPSARAERQRHGVSSWRRLRKYANIITGGSLIAILVVTGIVVPLVRPADPLQQDLRNAFRPPSQEHPFGTDEFGRDILTRVVHGARISLLEIGLAVTLALALGVPLGLAAGFFGGWFDKVAVWFMDVLFAFPGILLAILIVSVLGPSLVNMLVAISLFSVPIYGRLSRNLALTLRQLEFVEAATALGASKVRIIFCHILQNALAPLLVQATLTAGGVVLTAASLSFLGLGVQPPTPEWGAMISSGRAFVGVAPHLCFFPGLAITITVLGFNLLGDGLRDLLDPRLRMQ